MTSRRRFFALLGLVGAPSALWSSARAQDAADPIFCEATQTTPAEIIKFSQQFDVVDGHFDGLYDSSHEVTQSALSSQFSHSGKAGASLAADSAFDYSGPSFKVENLDAASGGQGVFTTTLYMDKPTTLKAIQRFHNGETYETDASFNPDLLVTTSFMVVAKWSEMASGSLTKPFTIDLVADGLTVATYGFDLTKVKWRPYVEAQDARFRAMSGVVHDPVAKTVNVEGCSVRTAGCFFTTAASLTLGLGDNCWELRTLRAFRDGPLKQTQAGRASVARYYAEAPRLVAAVNRRNDAVRQWLNAYWLYILPCAIMARLNFTRPAIRHYSRLFNRLAAAGKISI